MDIDLPPLLEIYREGIDFLIGSEDQPGLGKRVTLYFEETVVVEPSEQEIDFVMGGKRGPNYKTGATSSTVVNTEVIFALLKWNPKDFLNYQINVSAAQNVVRLKTFLSNWPSMSRCQYAVVNSDSSAVTGPLKIRLIKELVPIGLNTDRYISTYWSQF